MLTLCGIGRRGTTSFQRQQRGIPSVDRDGPAKWIGAYFVECIDDAGRGDEEAGEVAEDIEKLSQTEVGRSGRRSGRRRGSRSTSTTDRCTIDCSPEKEAQDRAQENLIRPKDTPAAVAAREHVGKAARNVPRCNSTRRHHLLLRRHVGFISFWGDHAKLRPLGKFDPRGLCPKLSPFPKALTKGFQRWA